MPPPGPHAAAVSAVEILPVAAVDMKILVGDKIRR